jgi:inorganic pyrophosphatase
LRHFFEEYKRLENKSVKVEEFQDKAKAYEILKESIDLYKETYGKA